MDKLAQTYRSFNSGTELVNQRTTSSMFDRLMQSAPAGRAARNRERSLPATPDYSALIDVLMRLYQIPDGLGETVLYPEEAAAIRRCGFVARAGATWRCPLLPNALVWSNPLLAHLSDDIEVYSRPQGWKPKRAAAVPYKAGAYAINKHEGKLYRTLLKAPGQCLTKRELQHRNWRMQASFFNRVLTGLIQRGSFTVVDGSIYPYDREMFEYLFNGQQTSR